MRILSQAADSLGGGGGIVHGEQNAGFSIADDVIGHAANARTDRHAARRQRFQQDISQSLATAGENKNVLLRQQSRDVARRHDRDETDAIAQRLAENFELFQVRTVTDDGKMSPHVGEPLKDARQREDPFAGSDIRPK